MTKPEVPNTFYGLFHMNQLVHICLHVDVCMYEGNRVNEWGRGGIT